MTVLPSPAPRPARHAVLHCILISLVCALLVPASLVQAESGRNLAFRVLLSNLQINVSLCVVQFDYLQRQYFRAQKSGNPQNLGDDVANTQDACMAIGPTIPPVLRPYHAVGQIVADWTAVLQHFSAATGDIGRVAFDDGPPAVANRDVTQHVRAANNLATAANTLALATAHSWRM